MCATYMPRNDSLKKIYVIFIYLFTYLFIYLFIYVTTSNSNYEYKNITIRNI